MFPPNDKSPYRVTPSDAKGRPVGRPVYLNAATRERAEAAGRKLLRLMGQRGRFSVRASLYNPLDDPEMHGFVRAL